MFTGGAEDFGVHVAARGIAEAAGGGEVALVIRAAFGAREDVIQRDAAAAFAGAVHGEIAPAAATFLGGEETVAEIREAHREYRTGGMRILSWRHWERRVWAPQAVKRRSLVMQMRTSSSAFFEQVTER